MSRRERVRRFVDGELSEPEQAALLAEASRDPALADELEAARALARALAAVEVPEPPADLVDRAVLRAVQRRAQSEERFDWKWLRPRVLRLRVTPSLLLAGVVAAALFGVWVTRDAGSSRARPSASASARMEASEALVRLMLPAEGAHTVAVAGEFNGWRTDDVFLEDPEGDGVFVGTLRLEPGSYAYMFVVDGERWVTDPYAVNHRDDGFGNQNAILRID